MLHLIPAPLHRALYRLADRLRRLWWLVRRPRRTSVNVVAFDERGRVLLVRHSYGPAVWALPGGALNRGEEPAGAATREFREELGSALRDLRSLGASTQHISGAEDLLHVFAAQVAGIPKPDMREIVAAEFFDPAALPRPLDRRVAGRVRHAVALRTGS